MNYKKRFKSVSILFIILLCISCQEGAENVSDATYENDLEARDELVTRYQELVNPGPENLALKKIEGNWSYQTVISAVKDGESMKLVGKATNKMVLGNRFLQSQSKDTLTENITFFGYDRRLEKYSIVRFDNWGTYYVTALSKEVQNKENWNGQVLTSGISYDPIFETQEKYEMNLQIIDDNQYLLEIVFHDEVSGSTYTSVRTIFNRIENEISGD